jgi:hypothetical protein
VSAQAQLLDPQDCSFTHRVLVSEQFGFLTLRFCHSKFWEDSSLSITGVVVELPNQKAQVFLVLIVLTRWFSEHIHKVFGEISVRT